VVLVVVVAMRPVRVQELRAKVTTVLELVTLPMVAVVVAVLERLVAH
jgi:hypothetical protein